MGKAQIPHPDSVFAASPRPQTRKTPAPRPVLVRGAFRCPLPNETAGSFGPKRRSGRIVPISSVSARSPTLDFARQLLPAAPVRRPDDLERVPSILLPSSPRVRGAGDEQVPGKALAHGRPTALPGCGRANQRTVLPVTTVRPTNRESDSSPPAGKGPWKKFPKNFLAVQRSCARADSAWSEGSGAVGRPANWPRGTPKVAGTVFSEGKGVFPCSNRGLKPSQSRDSGAAGWSVDCRVAVWPVSGVMAILPRKWRNFRGGRTGGQPRLPDSSHSHHPELSGRAIAAASPRGGAFDFGIQSLC